MPPGHVACPLPNGGDGAVVRADSVCRRAADDAVCVAHRPSLQRIDDASRGGTYCPRRGQGTNGPTAVYTPQLDVLEGREPPAQRIPMPPRVQAQVSGEAPIRGLNTESVLQL